MKCQRCGGLIVVDYGYCGLPDRFKCINCGREPMPMGAIQEGDDMKNPEITRDQEGNVITPEGFIYQPACMRKGRMTKEHYRKNGFKEKNERDYKKEYKKRKKKNTNEISEIPSKEKLQNQDLLTTYGTPEEIIRALRKGVAQEIMATILEKFV